MGRVYITDYVSFSSPTSHVGSSWRIYDDPAKTKLVFSIDNDPNNRMRLRFNTRYNGEDYRVHQGTRAEMRMHYSDGSTSKWYEFTPKPDCGNNL